MERMPFVRHPWYPQSAYLFRRARLHAPVPDPMGAFGEDYTYGSFSSRTPYAFKARHTGLDGYYGYGEDASDPCGVQAIQNLVVSKITAGIPTKLDLKVLGKTVFTIPLSSTIQSAIQSQLTALQPTVWAGLKTAAATGASAVRTTLNNTIAPVIVNALKPAAGNYAYLLPAFLDTALKSAYDAIAAQLQTCSGETGELEARFGTLGPAGSTPQVPMTQMELVAFQTAQMDISQLNARKPSAAIVGQLQTWAQWDAQCKAAGGAVVVNSDGSHTCVASTTASASASATGGVGGAAVVGGLALLAFLLLR